MKNRTMDSSTLQAAEVTAALFTVSYFDKLSLPIAIGTENTLPKALELSSDYLKRLQKQMEDADCEVPEGAQCAIDMRVCTTKGTTTQVVHLIR